MRCRFKETLRRLNAMAVQLTTGLFVLIVGCERSRRAVSAAVAASLLMAAPRAQQLGHLLHSYSVLLLRRQDVRCPRSAAASHCAVTESSFCLRASAPSRASSAPRCSLCRACSSGRRARPRACCARAAASQQSLTACPTFACAGTASPPPPRAFPGSSSRGGPCASFAPPLLASARAALTCARCNAEGCPTRWTRIGASTPTSTCRTCTAPASRSRPARPRRRCATRSW